MCHIEYTKPGEHSISEERKHSKMQTTEESMHKCNVVPVIAYESQAKYASKRDPDLGIIQRRQRSATNWIILSEKIPRTTKNTTKFPFLAVP